MFCFEYQTSQGKGFILAENESAVRANLAAAGITEDSILSITQVCEATLIELKKAGVWNQLPVDAKEYVLEQVANTLMGFYKILSEKSAKTEAESKEVQKSARILVEKAKFLEAVGGITPPMTVREERIAPRSASRTEKPHPNDCMDSIFAPMYR